MEIRSGLQRLALICLCALLGACAVFAPPRPYATEAEALAERGEPTRRWNNDDGTTTLEYSTQPNGISNLLVTVDSTGVVLRQEEALSPKNLTRVERGMTREEVDRLLGQHRSVQTFPTSGEEVWDWRIPDEQPWIVTLFNVHFIDGKVVRTSRSYLYPRDHMMFDPWYRDPFFASPFYGYRWYRAYPPGPYPRFRPWYFY